MGPDTRLTLHVNVELKTVAAVPLQVTEATPEMLSRSLPLIPIVDVLSAIVDPLGGETIATVGGVLSRFTVTEVFALFPATSVAVPETTSPITSFVIV